MINFLLKIPYYFSKALDKIKLEKHSKSFSNFDEAKKYCDSINPDSYENKDLNQYRYEKFINNLDLIPISYSNSSKLLLETLLIYLQYEKSLPKILDLGGVFGENQLYLKHLIQKNLIYDVVECDQIISLSKSKNFSHSKFFTSITEAKKNSNYDIIFSAGTIQYFRKPYETIEEMFSTKAKFIGLSRNNFSNDEKIYSEPSFMENHGGNESHIIFKYKNPKTVILYPNTQINEDKLNKIAHKHNYTLLRKSKGIEGNYGTNSYTNDLVFKLNK
tara:strand:- start:59 stop:880 length:822 start_codon:yes stop_codon:yes gene_type:complete